MKKITLTTLSLLIAISSNVFANNKQDLAEVAIGERLFLETRFAQAWKVNPSKADPALANTITTAKSRAGKYARGTMNCRACHMVDEHKDDLGTRTYADFAAASPIPNRNDGKHQTGRNSMSLVNISKTDVSNILFHFDGEFNSLEDLVVGTFTGRNFGWQATEKEMAIKHVANIIRNDDGKGKLASEFGGSYKKILKGTDKDLATEFRLPTEYRIDTETASDAEILDAVAKLITAYMEALNFSTDKKGLYNGSPYDAFLTANKLPRSPEKNESPLSYGQRLLGKINQLKEPVFVSEKQGKFETHKQKFSFAEKELKGLQLFLRSGSSTQSGGNCASCHQAPHFTDFRFHNTGISQNQYDQPHGIGAFNKIKIPNFTERSNNVEKYLPASARHPNALSIFRAKPNSKKPEHTDLGLWNITANANIPGPQEKIKAILCEKIKNCTADIMLDKSIAAFKTPSLRDTGHSAPYMHTGELNTLNKVIAMYIGNSELARQGRLRNTNTELLKIKLVSSDSEYLIAFLNSLNEDYD
ncbi:MAG: hypothetical protein KAT25_05590 [Sulfuriflexus sp.]|nr:hypothetical protein [Sulfuriflexus sp.]